MKVSKKEVLFKITPLLLVCALAVFKFCSTKKPDLEMKKDVLDQGVIVSPQTSK